MATQGERSGEAWIPTRPQGEHLKGAGLSLSFRLARLERLPTDSDGRKHDSFGYDAPRFLATWHQLQRAFFNSANEIEVCSFIVHRSPSGACFVVKLSRVLGRLGQRPVSAATLNQQ